MNWTEFLDYLFTNFTELVDFTKLYTPELGEDTLGYISADAAIAFYMGIGFLIVGFIVFLTGCVFESRNNDNQSEGMYITIGVVTLILSLIFGLTCICNNYATMIHPAGSVTYDMLTK